MNRLDHAELVALVKDRAGLSAREAKRALLATLGGLGSALDDADAAGVAAELPQELARAVERSTPAVVHNVQTFYAETERRERVGRGFAMEHAQVVLQVLAERLDPDLVQRLRKHLPSDVARLLKPRRAPAEPPPHVHTHPSHGDTPIQTLSRSRPGASETIAEARGALAHGASRSPLRTATNVAGEAGSLWKPVRRSSAAAPQDARTRAPPR